MVRNTAILAGLFLVALPFVLCDERDRARASTHDGGDHNGCHQDKDCGEKEAQCDVQSGRCRCPSKDYIEIPEAKPMCQKLAKIGESCKHDEQCQSVAGPLSRCESSKCECHDTEKNRDLIRLYQGTCYRATTENHTCTSENQCKASLMPEEHVNCVRSADGSGKNICMCDEGHKCEEKSGAEAPVLNRLASFATFTLVGIMATKIVL